MKLISKKILSIVITIFTSAVLTILVHGILLLTATSTTATVVTITGSGNEKFTGVQTTQYYPLSIAFILISLGVYLLAMWGTSHLAANLVKAKEIREDWGLYIKLISCTISVLVGLVTISLFTQGKPPSSILTGYIIIYFIFVTLLFIKNRKTLKGIPKKEIFT